MEQQLAAETFATIVGLYGLFKSERRSGEQATLDQYLDWLRRHEHGQVIKLIQDNAELTHSLRGLVEGQHDKVKAGLASLERLMVDVAGRLDQFNPIVRALGAKSSLSQQAISILKAMNESGASSFYTAHSMNAGYALKFADGTKRGAQISITELRFLDDDLAQLVDTGLLIFKPTATKGSDFFRITRLGAEVGDSEQAE